VASTRPTAIDRIREFSSEVSRYFLEFLETDFHRQRMPRRRVRLTNDQGLRTAINLRSFPDFAAALWTAASSTDNKRHLTVRRGRYRTRPNPILQNLIVQHLDSITEEVLARVRTNTLATARENRAQGSDDPEKYVESIRGQFSDEVLKELVAPVLHLLESSFRQLGDAAADAVFGTESDLLDVLIEPAFEPLGPALNTLLLTGNQAPLKSVLDEFFSRESTIARMSEFFAAFATADLFDELREVMNYLAAGAEGFSLYAYFGDIKHGSAKYPLFYVVLATRFDSETPAYELELDSRFFVHKQAFDYVFQEISKEGARAVSVVEQRIVHLEAGHSLVDDMAPIANALQAGISLNGSVDFRNRAPQKADSAVLAITNSTYLAAFEKSDEGLLNDYEALITVLEAEHARAGDMFTEMVRGMLLQDPPSVRAEVESAWDGLPIPERLVADTPIPINEEQRKILSAVRNEKCRYIIVQGPPGTGKSHTITAVAFDCIMSGRNILVLSDKKEALDVVEAKLRDALTVVRPGDDFPDPILRLGRAGGTYTRLMASGAQNRIRTFHKAQSARELQMENDRARKKDDLKTRITGSVNAYAGVSMAGVVELHRLERSLEKTLPGLPVRLQKVSSALAVGELLELTRRVGRAADAAAFLTADDRADTAEALWIAAGLESSVRELADRGRFAKEFGWLTGEQRTGLAAAIVEAIGLRWPLLGYLFTGSKVAAVSARVTLLLGGAQPIDMRLRAPDLQRLLEAQRALLASLEAHRLNETLAASAWSKLKSAPSNTGNPQAVSAFVFAFAKAVGKETIRSIHPAGASGSDLLQCLLDAARYAQLWQHACAQFAKAPEFDYAGLKSELEVLNVSRMAHEIDGRFVRFVDNSRATAQSLAGVIKGRRQFPQTEFGHLKEAFPCVIAGIREFAEYIPLQAELFDVVVIDEASQVSVAQALPALLRGKKVVVLGDRQQFANVKSATASGEMNRRYLHRLDRFFREHISVAQDKIERLKHFDVKRSILDFFGLIANFEIMLLKHFRGYAETISFSSRYYYNGQLQAIKIRSRPVSEVIKFHVVDPSSNSDRKDNVNEAEAQFILEELRAMVKRAEEDEAVESVAVITPFREQHAYLTKLLLKDADAERFERELRLKIMTFDTCQGEERDVIFYSMVATEGRDMLNYVLPVNLDPLDQDSEENLKKQRLNVGLSRAKETMVFVLSKPIESYKGTAARLLQHYKSVLDKPMPGPEKTDPRSPMERKVLDWLQRTAFFQNNRDSIEIQPQFPVGDYLRQLDETYRHPAYRCDFLVTVALPEKSVQIIVEYDGFEHFLDGTHIDAGNYSDYYKPEDLERQFVLEDYGYRFLRINRFNLGHDPVAQLSDRLTKLVDVARHEPNHEAVEGVQADAQGLANGELRTCTRCKQIKSAKEFWDQSLGNGAGGTGRVCMSCKRRQGKSTRRFWRRR
jgi:hypothetical protein